MLLARSRLLTLTGPGGAGKTRLAIELARRSAGEFFDGASFVPLAAVRDPALVPVEIAGGLGLQDSRGTPLLDHIVANLAGRNLLLVLDNMEQVLEASGFVADLLSRTEKVSVVATSRAPLHLSWEQELPVPPLPEGPQLFAARAAASDPGFELTEANAATLERIAEPLDGLPLAIELAAVHVRVLAPEAILARLGGSLGLLVSGNRDVPERHRTLRATISWTHDLLSDYGQRLFAICSVFRGGIGLAALTEVCESVGFNGSVLDAVAEVVDHSLLRRADEGTPRFAMLETVREFAAEQLAASKERRATHDAHAHAFWRRVEPLPRPPATPDRADLITLEREHDNLRAALDHYLESDPARALRMANRLTGFWSIRGYFTEGRRRLADLRQHATDGEPDFTDALIGEAWLATDQGDRATALPRLDEALAAARATGDRSREADALLARGRTRGVIGDPAGARDDVEEAIAIHEGSGDAVGLAIALWLGGAMAHFAGELEAARDRLEACEQRCAECGQPVISARAEYLLGAVRMDLGELSGAEAALAQAVPAVVEVGDRFGLPIALTILAGLAAKRSRPRTALRLTGAAFAHEQADQTYRPQFIRILLEGWLAPVRAQVGSAAIRLQVEGRTMEISELIAAGLDPRPEDPWHLGTSPALTEREREIAILAAQGLTNRQIAGHLVLSVRTVETHVSRVFAKLGFNTRGQLTVWAHEEGLMTDVRGEVT